VQLRVREPLAAGDPAADLVGYGEAARGAVAERDLGGRRVDQQQR
jgi:hypothetical protein